ncbi:MAG: hypothetical protein KDA25_03155 [Phycisphaerales bacterium]|nr:hypothetical protein [Phycisphaerales bacterium]
MLIAALGAASLFGAGCETYRIERHHRPGYYDSVSETPLPDRVVLEDGTIIVYEQGRRTKSAMTRVAETPGEGFKVREELEDGTVILRAVLPEQALSNVADCLYTEQYDLLYDQALSPRTREALDERGGGKAEFLRFFQSNRRDILVTLNRMIIGLAGQGTTLERMGDNLFRCRLHPSIAKEVKFSQAIIEWDGTNFRFVTIKP